MTAAAAGNGGDDAQPDVPPISVVVVSRARPAQLSLCLSALTLQSHPRMEVVLVADAAGIAVRPDLPLKRVPFDAPNISRARNLGIAAAAGEVVAFIDDDAVAEPPWGARLAAAFADRRVVAATGLTRGPDGLRWQTRAERMTPDGPEPLDAPHGQAQLVFPAGSSALSTLGTNCAFRREALLAVGGFDPAFAYHLDESDLNLRLAARFPDAPSALVPLAEVTHGAAPGTVRDAAGLPSDLAPIGRSAAIFARRHGGDPDAEARRQRKRLLRLMLGGRLDPMRVRPLLSTLDAGARAGAAMPAPPLPSPMPAGTPPAFLPLPTRARRCLLLADWHWHASRLRAQAAAHVSDGLIVTLLLLTPTLLPHRAAFRPGGWWEQRGGLWGPSGPDDPPLLSLSRRARVMREERRGSAARCADLYGSVA